jgi:hypothetical protein
MGDKEFNPRRIHMSLIRTSILALTAAVAVGSALASSTTSAQAWHHHHHWKKWHNHHSYYRPYYYAAPVVYSSYRPAPRVVSAPAPAPVATPNPASCLSKAYTPEGQVVFSDNCTKESAMAPVPNVPQQQSQMPAQQNFAGKPQQ